MSDPSTAHTEILETKVVSTSGDAFRIEMVLADKPNAEEATETIAVTVRVNRSDVPGRYTTLPRLADLQTAALHRAVSLIREHTNAIDKEIEEAARRF